MAATPIRGFPPALQQRVLGASESFWTGTAILFDNGLFLRLEGGGRAGGYYWTFGTFLAGDGNPLRPSYADVERWTGEHRSSHARAYLSPRKTDPATRASFETLAGQLGASWVALMLMERKAELVTTRQDARWTIDARFFTRERVETTAPALAVAMDALVDALTRCSTGCFAAKMHRV